jgi:hypothetical protein
MEHVSSALAARPLSFSGPASFGHRSPPPERARDALSRIRGLRGDPALRITHVAVADDGLTEKYADDQGYDYRVRRADGALVEVDRDEDIHSKARPARPEARLPVVELRRMAMAIVEKQRPAFEQERSSYHPFEGNRDRELYLFRWEDFSRPLAESRTPPFVQVGLYADGLLASYADTLGQ